MNQECMIGVGSDLPINIIIRVITAKWIKDKKLNNIE